MNVNAEYKRSYEFFSFFKHCFIIKNTKTTQLAELYVGSIPSWPGDVEEMIEGKEMQ